MSTEVERGSQQLKAERVLSGERFLQACGIVIFVALIAAGQVSPDPPSHGGTDDQVLAFYQQHAGGVCIGAFLWDLAMVALLLFTVALRRSCERSKLKRSSQRLLLVVELLPLFGSVSAGLFIASQALEAGAGVLAMHGLSAVALRVLDEASHVIAHLATLPLGSLIFAAGLAQRTANLTASWIAWLGVIAGFLLVVTTSWIALDQQWIHNAGVIGLLLFLFWTLISSIALLRKKALVEGDQYA